MIRDALLFVLEAAVIGGPAYVVGYYSGKRDGRRDGLRDARNMVELIGRIPRGR